MSERLIDRVAEARTPAEALRAVRDWLEQHGAPEAALGIHREVTDTTPREAFRWSDDLEAQIENLTDELNEAKDTLCEIRDTVNTNLKVPA